MRYHKKLTFDPIVQFNQKTNEFDVRLKELGLNSKGASINEAVDNLCEILQENTKEFFHNIEFYMAVPEIKKICPYYMVLGKYQSNADLKKLLKVNHIRRLGYV